MAPKQAFRQFDQSSPTFVHGFGAPRAADVIRRTQPLADLRLAKAESNVNIHGQPRLAPTLIGSRLQSMPEPASRRSALPMDFSFGAADEADQPLPVAGFKGTPEEIERQWYEQVYRGRGDSMTQLTWRAVLPAADLSTLSGHCG